VRRTTFLGIILAAVAAWCAVSPDYLSAKRKFDLIESGRLRPGSRVDLTPRELTAWAAQAAPDGVRDPQLKLVAPGVATGTAMVDFGRVQRAQGYQPGWLMSKLLEGERFVSVTAHIRSDNGTATVDVDRVQISGVEIDGATLDFLIRNFLLALYPDAAVGRPFALTHCIRKLDVQPGGVGVLIGQ
jgi:hypothetical protein